MSASARLSTKSSRLAPLSGSKFTQPVVPNRHKKYFYSLLAKYLAYYVPQAATVIEVGARDGSLLDALRAHNVRVEAAGLDSPAPSAASADRVILNGVLHFVPDIQAVLDHVRGRCSSDTRILITYFSSLWKPLLGLASRLGLADTGSEQNWLAPSDVRNLLQLSGFEIVAESQRVLLPIYIPVISVVLNRWLAPLPGFRMLALSNVIVARLRPAAAPEPLSVSIIVPARNERGNVEALLKRLPGMGPDDEVIFVEGNSQDGTWEEIQRVVASTNHRSVRAFQQAGRGKGDAVRLGFGEARRDILMILDADLSVPPEELPKFYRALTSGAGEFVNGSRLVYPMEHRAMRFANMIGNKFFATAFSFLLNQPLKDTLCGTKVLRRRHYQAIADNRAYFGDFDPFGDFDLLFGAARQGLRIVELPIRYRERTYGETNIQRWKHGWLLLRMTIFAARRMKFL